MGIRDRLLARLLRLSKRHSRRRLAEWLDAVSVDYALAECRDVLNVGAGGEIAALLARAGVRARSVDMDPAREPDLVADLCDLAAIPDASVDVVFVMEVLEHVREPAHAVAAMQRVLRPGGLVVGSTPFLLGMHDLPHDYYRYTLHGLGWLLRGFDVLTLRERNGYFAAIAVLLLRPYARVGDTRRARALLMAPVLVPLALFIGLLDRLWPSLDATTGYFFVCRKRAPVATEGLR